MAVNVRIEELEPASRPVVVMNWLFIALCALGTLECRGADPLSTSIGALAASGPGTSVVLSEHTRFGWDRVCIFGPYTPDEKVDAVTGIRGAAARAYDIRSNDTISVMMFIRESRIVGSVAHPRNRGDFGPEVAGNCYPRAQAVFSIRKPPANSWGDIGPP